MVGSFCAGHSIAKSSMIIVLSHPCSLVSYLSAHAILTSNAGRSTSVAVNIIEQRRSLFKNSPWCGVSTIGSQPFHHHVVTEILNTLASQLHVVPISLANLSRSQPLYPDLPARPLLKVHTTTATNTNTLGYIYHPILLMKSLRSGLSGSGRVSFMSPSPGISVDDVVKEISIFHHPQQILVIDFGEELTSFPSIDLVVYSSLCQLDLVPAIGLPLAILWLPHFRAINRLWAGPRPHTTTKISQDKRLQYTNIRMGSTNDLPQLDLLVALRHVDVALFAIAKARL